MNDPLPPFTSGTEKKKFLPDSAHLLKPGQTHPGQDRAMAADAQETGRRPNRQCLLFLGGQIAAYSGKVYMDSDMGSDQHRNQPERNHQF